MEQTVGSKQRNSILSQTTNPIIRKLSKVEGTSENAVTYAGIAGKCGFFLVMIAVGVALAVVLQSISPMTMSVEGEIVTFSVPAVAAAVVCGLIFIIMPLLAVMLHRTIPVTGSLFCISSGYLVNFMGLMMPSYQPLIMLAFVLTVATVTAMALLYSKGVVRVTKKFRTVVTTLLLSTIAGGLLLLICSLVPTLRPVAALFIGDPLMSIGISVVYVVIAALFLLVDFDEMQRMVERRLDIKYEWVAAFALCYSVIWLYFKILDLVIKASEAGKKK